MDPSDTKSRSNLKRRRHGIDLIELDGSMTRILMAEWLAFQRGVDVEEIARVMHRVYDMIAKARRRGWVKRDDFQMLDGFRWHLERMKGSSVESKD